MIVRLWVNGEDYGTMSESCAKAYKRVSEELDPADVVSWELEPE